MASVFPLPLPLLLLVHLHILAYPHANKPEYDENLFNPRMRGLRERTKSMEDVAYFLARKLNGDAQAKQLLPTYPCVQPSDTTAFRAALTKYLEGLRHAALRAPGGSSTAEKSSSGAAGWWRDVVVRKSLLEECAGERFEQLFIAFSTHVLSAKSALADASPAAAINLLRELPKTYSAHLAAAQAAHASRKHEAALLLQRQADLALFRERLVNGKDKDDTSPYASLSTPRLVALAESRRSDLQWPETALDFVLYLADLAPAPLPAPSDADTPKQTAEDAPAPPTLPLPVAAAHHPGHIRRLHKPLFPAAAPAAPTGAEAAPTADDPEARARMHLAPEFDAVAQTQRALADALVLAQRTRDSFTARLASQPRAAPARDVHLWARPPRPTVDFHSRPTPALLAAAGLTLPASGPGALEARIDHVRGSLLPPFPDAPAPAPPPPSPSPPPVTSEPPAPSAGSRQPQMPPRARQPPAVVFSPAATPRPAARARKSIRASMGRVQRPPLFVRDSDEGHALPQPTAPASKPRRDEPSGRSTVRHAKVSFAMPTEDTLPRLDALSDEGGDGGEGHSMTLRDILLRADATFDLLGEDVEEDLGGDSFVWE